FLKGEDCLRTARAFAAMGVAMEDLDGEELVISGRGLRGLQEPEEVIDCGNSGTTMRLLAGVLAAQPFLSILTGDGSLRRRPMGRIVEPLRKMGAQIWGRENGNLPPLAILGGPLKGIAYESPLASAQVKSALLLAGLFAEGETVVVEPFPSRDHTERMLKRFGVSVRRNGTAVTVKPPKALIPQQITVPGDFSSAAFFLVAALIVPGSELLIKDVGVNPTRTGFLDALRLMGAEIELDHLREVSGEPVADIRAKASPLRGIELKGALIPRMIDEIPAFAVAACQAEGISVIRDASELRVKETDRLSALARELRKLGAQVEELPDGLLIGGGGGLKGADGETYGDHRMAMALSVAGLVAEGETSITDASWVDISFPGFFETLAQLAPGALQHGEQRTES
ncbi:MAG: 3-phosphoshikimate 1-carboxyvinyltransferase, partial [Candidatus Methylomirabilales bacterium]